MRVSCAAVEESMNRREFLGAATAALVLPRVTRAAVGRHLLYVATPGIRNYVEYGGVGVLVYDIDAGYKFVRRIASMSYTKIGRAHV